MPKRKVAVKQKAKRKVAKRKGAKSRKKAPGPAPLPPSELVVDLHGFADLYDRLARYFHIARR